MNNYFTIPLSLILIISNQVKNKKEDVPLRSEVTLFSLHLPILYQDDDTFSEGIVTFGVIVLLEAEAKHGGEDLVGGGSERTQECLN